jgi:hypothetical protein
MSLNKKVWYAPNKKEAYGDREIQAVLDCLNERDIMSLFFLSKIYLLRSMV